LKKISEEYSNYNKMSIVVDKSNIKNIEKILKKKLKLKTTKGNLSNHYGKLKRSLDGLEYQMEIRADVN
jgi:hypothetical protein